VAHFCVVFRFDGLTFENRGAIGFIARVITSEVRRVFLDDIEMGLAKNLDFDACRMPLGIVQATVVSGGAALF